MASDQVAQAGWKVRFCSRIRIFRLWFRINMLRLVGRLRFSPKIRILRLVAKLPEWSGSSDSGSRSGCLGFNSGL